MEQVHHDQNLKITEIYKSVQGESSFAGLPCTFIRLTGCPLRCRWCDTAYGFEGGSDWTIGDVLGQAKRLGVPLVELTGGEPLAQKPAADLVKALHELGYKVLIETSGSESIVSVVDYAHIIMDIKCPGSRMEAKNRYENLNYLKKTDEIKFVVADKEDFHWAVAKISEFNLAERFQCLISPAFGLVKPSDLVEWMMAEPSLGNVRLNLQIHKFIWSPRAKGV